MGFVLGILIGGSLGFLISGLVSAVREDNDGTDKKDSER